MIDEESVLKPIGLAGLIERTSAGDLLLFMIALNRASQPLAPATSIIIGFND